MLVLSLILGLIAFLRQIRLHFDFVEFAFPLCFQELHDACIVFSGTPEMPFKREPHNATLSVGGSSQWCAFNNAALCKRTASCICPRSLNAACFSGPLNSNSELLQVVNMVIAVFVTLDPK